MSENIKNIDSSSDVISLKDLIISLQGYWKEVWKYKFWVIATILLFSFLLAIKAKMAKPVYRAQLTFMINDEEGGSGLSGIGAILGSFGLDGAGGDGQNLDKILQLSKARKISQNAFFEKVEIDGNTDYLANHVINYQDSLGMWFKPKFYQFWMKESPLKEFRFTHDSIAIFNKSENLGLKIIHLIVSGNNDIPGITSAEYNDDSGIMTISTTAKNPNVAFHLTKQSYNALQEYYVFNSTEKQRITYDLVKVKTDSIQQSLRADEYALATLKDTKRQRFLTKDKLPELRLEGRIKMGYAALGKALENLEIADFTLKNKTPFIQVIDEPLQPLLPVKPSIVKGILFGAILGGFLSIGLILLRKIYRQTMA